MPKGFDITDDLTGMTIAHVYDDPFNPTFPRLRAQLIAAAPKLLDQLSDLVDHFQRNNPGLLVEELKSCRETINKVQTS
jgi:hypothetical protein